MFAPQIGGGKTGTGSPAQSAVTPGTRRGEERLARGFASRTERERVLRWLEAGLRPGRPGRLEREYPLCLSADALAVPFTAWHGTEPAAFCVLLPTRFVLGAGRLGAGLVSLVYTDPRHRGRGLARRVVAGALAEARAQELALVLLWSEPGLDAFYSTQGFTRVGGESLVTLDRDGIARALADEARACAPPSRTPLRIEPASEAHWSAIQSLRARRSCHAPLAGDANTWLGMPDLAACVARRAGEVVGFAMRGRGDDFPGVVHEWGGETEAVLRCCAALLPASPADGLLLLAPRETTPLAWRLRRVGARQIRQPLAWTKITCGRALARDLAAIAPALAGLAIERLDRPAAPGVRVSHGSSGLVRELSEAQWLGALLGGSEPGADSDADSSLRGLLPEPALARLPLPFFVSGLESI